MINYLIFVIAIMLIIVSFSFLVFSMVRIYMCKTEYINPTKEIFGERIYRWFVENQSRKGR